MKNQLVLMLFICSLITSIDSADSGSLNVRMSSGYNGISNSVLPECPVLNLPLNGDTLIMQSGIVPINFTTSGDENTTHQWRLYFGTDPNNLANFGGYLVGGNGNVGTAVPVMPGETYYWVVTELNAYGESEKCEIFSFTMTQECPELNLAIGDPCDDGNDDTFNDPNMECKSIRFRW